MIAIGIGANSRAKIDDISAALVGISEETSGADVVATLQGTAVANVVERAARGQSLACEVYPLEALRERNEDCVTRSPTTLDRLGVASVAECSALAAAGPGSRLLLRRRIVGNVTVAAARSVDSNEAPR